MGEQEKKKNLKSLILALSVFGGMLIINCIFMLIRFAFGGSFEAGGPLFWRAFGVGFMTLSLITVSLFTYIVFSRRRLLRNTRSLTLMCLGIASGVAIGISVSFADIYYIPITLTAFLLVPLIDKRDVFFANIITVLSVTVILFFEMALGGQLDSVLPVVVMMFLGIFMGSVVAYVMSVSSSRLGSIVRGLVMAGIYVAILFIFSLMIDAFNFASKIIFITVSALGQLFAGIALQPLFERLFKVLTNARLNELADHRSPLISRLIKEAPGTFNHSLAVASFAEMCAINIGENPTLARTCAYYHDIGKLENPLYFAENQSKYNAHDELLPEVSAQVLRNHTVYGKELCEKYGIPDEIGHVTVQHHGTLPMIVFYEKARRMTDGEVDISEYSYHGETPVSKIAAIIMICDAAEAALRSMASPTAQQVDGLVTGIVNDRIQRRQFDNCDITMRDLKVVRQTIISVYGGLFHERVKYPSGDKYND